MVSEAVMEVVLISKAMFLEDVVVIDVAKEVVVSQTMADSGPRSVDGGCHWYRYYNAGPDGLKLIGRLGWMQNPW